MADHESPSDLPDEPTPARADRERFALVSRRIHADGLRPRFLAHDAPLGSTDSGWQLLLGDETRAELDDPDAILVQPLRFLAERWPGLDAVFDDASGTTAWVWDEAAERYVPYVREA